MLHTGFFKQKYVGLLAANLIGWMVSMIGSLADSVLAGIYLGEEAVAAVELVSPMFSLMFFLSCFLAIGTATVYSRTAGAFEREKSYTVAGMSILLSVLGGIVMMIAMFAFEDAYFAFYTSSPEIEFLAREYYRSFIVEALIHPVYWTAYYLVIADGDAVSTLFTDLVSAFGNAALSILFVNKYGIRGLALGTVGSLIISGVFVVLHFFKKSNSVKLIFKFDKKLLKEILIVGSTSSFTTLYMAIVNMVMNKLVILRFGDRYLAAFAVVNLVLGLGACFSCATDAAASFISVSWGEGNPKAIQKIMKTVTISTACVGAVFIAGIELLAPLIPELYGISDPEVYVHAVFAGRLLGISYVAICFLTEFISYYPRIEKIFLGNVMSAVYLLVAPMVLAVPMSALGFNGLVVGFFLTPFATMIFTAIYIIVKYGTKKLPLVLDEPEERIYIHELMLCDEEIVELNRLIAAELSENNVSPELSTRIELLIEESFMIVRKKNPEKKVLAECTLMVGDKKVRLITRDNGVIFDITDTDAKVDSLSSYVAARLMETEQENAYLTTISFNRNSYAWNR